MIIVPSLHLNTEYSLLESAIKIDDLILFAKENKLKELVITDHNVMSGVGEFIAKTKKAKIKPVIGIDLDVEDFQLILLAKNYDGYKHLMALSSKKMNHKEIKLSDINPINIFIIDHPLKGYFAKNGRQLKLKNYFVGTTTKTFANAVFTQETKILYKKDNLTLSILSAISNNEKILENAFDYNEYIFQGQIKDHRFEQAVAIINECNIKFPINHNLVPKFNTSKAETSQGYFKKIIQKEAKKKLIDVLNKEIYIKRIKFEVDIIEKLGFTDYFLIIWDLTSWARNNNILIGPGRGSAAGSLVSYLLGITNVDPIKFDLLFERFLNPERISMPDIDIDIQDDKRDELINYLFKKYGQKNVAFISTFQKFGSKMALRDVARSMSIPLRDIDYISKTIPFKATLTRAYKDSVAFRAIINRNLKNTTLFNYAKLIEGFIKQTGTHASGIVISDISIMNKIATFKTQNNLSQTQFSMNYLEAYGLLKIDLLGLKNLTILQNIQNEISHNYGKKIDFKKIPLNDKSTNILLSQGDTNGIFQLESSGMKSTIAKIGITSFNDIVAIISLFRPGPIDNISLYAKRKNGDVSIEKISPEYDEIVKLTYGIIVYQEQIMQITQKFAGMTFGQADILRRAISKKNQKSITNLKEKFIKGALSKGQDLGKIKHVYSLIEKFANYGFNKSHAVAYGFLTYWLAFLKTRFPIEFYTAILNASNGSRIAIEKYINEAKQKGIRIIQPNINFSKNKVFIKNNKIILPLTLAKGLSSIMNEKLITLRKAGAFIDFFDFILKIKIANIDNKIIELLINCGSLRDFGNVQTLNDALPLAIRYVNMITINSHGNKVVNSRIMTNIVKPKLIKLKENIIEQVSQEKKIFGFQLSSFVTLEYEGKIKIKDIKVGKTHEVILFIEKLKEFNDKNGQKMLKIIASDSSAKIDVVVFHSIYKFIVNPKNNCIVRATITRRDYNGIDSFSLNKPWEEIYNG